MQKPFFALLLALRSLLSVVQSLIQKKRFKSFVSQNQRSKTLKLDMNTVRFIKCYRELICIVCRRGAIGFLCVKWTLEIMRTAVWCIPAPFFSFSFFNSLLFLFCFCFLSEGGAFWSFITDKKKAKNREKIVSGLIFLTRFTT